MSRRITLDHTMVGVCLLVICTLWLTASSIMVSAATVRNANPTRNFLVVDTPVLFMNMTTPGWTGTQSIPFQPTFGGTALPLSSNADFSIDVPIMLPHKNDDIDGCSGAWNTTNEFGQSFQAAGAFILIRQSSCTYTTYLMAMYSGAAGIIVYGCPGEKPYNCITKLHEVLVYTKISVPVISITTADGEAMVTYLTTAKANGTIPATTTLMARFRSTGNIVTSERNAIISIMSESSMGPFANGAVPDVLPLWNATQLRIDPSFDPCRARLKGLWCEAGHVVLISVYYNEWYNFALDSNHQLITPSFMPKGFGSLTKLRYMNIQANVFAGAIPPEWCALTEIEVIWMDSQYRPGGASLSSLPDCIGNWTQLQELRIALNNVQYLPPAFSTLTNIRYLGLGRNQLTSIPDISGMINLMEFDADQNQLTVLPTPSPLAPLTIYSVPNNLFNGSLPVNFFDGFSSLQILDINSNQFYGPLPSLIGCTSLQVVDFGSQRDITVDVNGTGTRGFTGPMPVSWKNLDLLTKCYLQENLLTGPMYLSSMQSVEYLDVSHNLLASTTDPAHANNAAGLFIDTLTSPSQISIRASYNPGIKGVLLTGLFETSTTMRELYLDHCGITGLSKEYFAGFITTTDLSYNNISRDFISQFPISAPIASSLLFDIRGNPYYSFDTLPSWVYADSSRIQAAGTQYACAPLKAPTVPLLSFYVDPQFYEYQYCECATGTFGKPPLCSHIPSSAQLNPLAIISSTEIGTQFAQLISQTGGVGGSLYAVNTGSGSTNVNLTADVYAQSFSDSMYGENRLTLGMATSWVIDLSNLFSDDLDAYAAANLNAPALMQQYAQDPSLDIPNFWTPVRVITVRLHISATQFTQFEDVLNVFEGGSDLKGNRVLTIRGTDTKPTLTSSAYTRTSNYFLQNNASLSQVDDPRLIEVQVFSRKATVQFTSRANSGLHFYATYSYDFECPDGYFYNTAASPAQCHLNRVKFDIGSGIRGAVFAISAVAFVWVLFNIVILAWKWDSQVYKAASRVFMLLILVLLLTMPLGSLLYAAIPEAGTASGAAICIGRAWLTCLPLAGVLAVLLAKTNRLDSIFGATQLQVKKHTDLDILKMVLIVCSLQIGLLAIFSGLPLSRAVSELGKGSLSEELVNSCSQEHGFMSWFGAEVAFMALLMLPAAYLGFKTRDLPSQFNESSHIQNALLLLMFFGCIIIPLDIFIQDTPEAAVLIQGLGQAFLCIVLTGIIFGPKLYYLTIVAPPGTHTRTYIPDQRGSVVSGTADSVYLPPAKKQSGQGANVSSREGSTGADQPSVSQPQPYPHAVTPGSRPQTHSSGKATSPALRPSVVSGQQGFTFSISSNQPSTTLGNPPLYSIATPPLNSGVGPSSATQSPRALNQPIPVPASVTSTARRVIKIHTTSGSSNLSSGGGTSIELVDSTHRGVAQPPVSPVAAASVVSVDSASMPASPSNVLAPSEIIPSKTTTPPSV